VYQRRCDKPQLDKLQTALGKKQATDEQINKQAEGVKDVTIASGELIGP